jgi:hypothetical protein
MAKEAPIVKRLITLDVPLTIGGDAGTLSISAEADDRHQASLINWLGREVAEAIGTSLGRGTSNKL